jgi:stage II sporulation protein AB (anti-sigma F factor)
MAVTTTRLELQLPAVPTSIRTAREAVAEVVEELDAGDRLADDARLCVSEAVTNVVRHAYVGRERGGFDLLVEVDDGELNVVVRDSGRGTTASRRRAGVGGYGLKIIDRLTRSFAIASHPGTGTEIRMIFRLSPKSVT